MRRVVVALAALAAAASAGCARFGFDGSQQQAVRTDAVTTPGDAGSDAASDGRSATSDGPVDGPARDVPRADQAAEDADLAADGVPAPDVGVGPLPDLGSDLGPLPQDLGSDQALPDLGSVVVSHTWSFGVGGSSTDKARGVAVDGNGNVIVVGAFFSSADFGGGPLSGGDDQIFVASYDANGNYRWAKDFGSLDPDIALAVTVDANNNIVVTGAFETAVNFGGGTLNGDTNGDAFVASFDAQGNYRWAKNLPSSNGASGKAVVTDPSGNVYVTGRMFFDGDLGAGPVTGSGFIVSYTSSGGYRWGRVLSPTGRPWGSAISLDATGNIFVTGNVLDTVDLGSGAFTSQFNDAFIASYDSNGNHRWSRIFSGPNNDYGNGIVVFGNEVTAFGAFTGTIDFGDGAGKTGGTYLASYTLGGAHRWSRTFGAVRDAAAVTADANGNIFVAGGLSTGAVDLGGGALSGGVFLAAYDRLGRYLWSDAYSASQTFNVANAVAASGSDLFVTGTFLNAIDFGTPLTASGVDVFLLRMNAAQP